MAIIGKAIYTGKKNLKNTTWVFNEEIDLIHGPHAEESNTGWSFQADVEFEVHLYQGIVINHCTGIQGSYTFLGGGVPGWGSMSYKGSGPAYDYNESSGGNWIDDGCKTIIITGNCYDIELHKWLLNNATLQT